MEHLHIISFFALLTLASAQYPWPLLCPPKPPTATPFDPERVSGIFDKIYFIVIKLLN